MNDRLNELEKNKKIILQKVKEIDTKPLSKKWKVLYAAGYIGMMAITTIIFYPNNMMLALFLTIGYGIGMPALSAVIDNSKRNRLRKKYSSINREIEQIQKQIINQNLTEERLRKDIPITSHQQYKMVEEKVLADLEQSERDKYFSENESFFFGEDYDETNEAVIGEYLSNNESKGYTRKKKR